METARKVYMLKALEDLKRLQRELEYLIGAIPTSEARNDVTGANILILSAIDSMTKGKV